jgi:hypothetical protein
VGVWEVKKKNAVEVVERERGGGDKLRGGSGCGGERKRGGDEKASI